MKHAPKFLALTALIGSQSAIAQLTVSDAGRPSYTYTIDVPPGIAGLVPKLALSYTGGAVNGPVGYGWAVHGVSVITRCAPIRAIDGRKPGVSFAADDKLCLDGQRLIPIYDGTPSVGAGTNDAVGLDSSSYREYRTETDSFASIRAFGYANGDTTGASGPAYFKVYTKGGLLLEYGDAPSASSNTKALISAQGKTTAMLWAVARITSRAGSGSGENRPYVDFKYEQRDVAWGSGGAGGTPTLGREWNLIEIQYNKTNKVILRYADRASTLPQDASEAYQQGSKSVSMRLLQSITTYINSPNTTVLGPSDNAVASKTIKLTYDNGAITKRSRLMRIQQCAGGPTSTRCMPANQFTYTDGGNDFYVASSTFNLGSLALHNAAATLGVIARDFNGDGKADLLRWSDNPIQNQLWVSNGDGSFAQIAAFNIQGQNLFKSDDCYVSFFEDVNADGLTDIIRYSAPTSVTGAACTAYGGILLYTNNGNGTFTQRTYVGPTLRRDNTANFFVFDVDGDGMIDLVTTLAGTWVPGTCAPGMSCIPKPKYQCADPLGVCTRVYRGVGDGAFSEMPTNIGDISAYSTPTSIRDGNLSWRLQDLNGDGLQDLGKVYSGEARVMQVAPLRSRGDGNFDVVDWSENESCSHQMDFNGDGRVDCLQAYSNILSTSDGARVENFSVGNKLLAGSDGGVAIADVNGDGRDDIISWKDDAAQNILYFSNGDGTFTPSSTFNLAGVQLKKSDGSAAFVIGDFMGYGRAEILRLQTVGSTTTNRLYLKGDPTAPDQLTSAVSPTGATTQLHYVSLGNPLPAAGALNANLGPRYTSDRNTASAASVPTIDVVFPIHVVATMVSDSGVGSNKVISEYSYAGLKADTQGRGLLGFREVRVQRPGADGSPLTTVTQFLQVAPYIRASLNTTVHLSALNATSTANMLSSTANVYCDQAAPAGSDATALSTRASCPSAAIIQRPYLLLSTQTGQDLQGVGLPTVTVETSINANGNPTRIVQTTNGTVGGVSQSYVKTVVNEYFPDSVEFWIPGKLKQSIVTGSVPNTLLTTSAGSSPMARATQGTTTPPLSADVLSVIFQILLDD